MAGLQQSELATPIPLGISETEMKTVNFSDRFPNVAMMQLLLSHGDAMELPLQVTGYIQLGIHPMGDLKPMFTSSLRGFEGLRNDLVRFSKLLNNQKTPWSSCNSMELIHS